MKTNPPRQHGLSNPEKHPHSARGHCMSAVCRLVVSGTLFLILSIFSFAFAAQPKLTYISGDMSGAMTVNVLKEAFEDASNYDTIIKTYNYSYDSEALAGKNHFSKKGGWYITHSDEVGIAASTTSLSSSYSINPSSIKHVHRAGLSKTAGDHTEISCNLELKVEPTTSKPNGSKVLVKLSSLAYLVYDTDPEPIGGRSESGSVHQVGIAGTTRGNVTENDSVETIAAVTVGKPFKVFVRIKSGSVVENLTTTEADGTLNSSGTFIHSEMKIEVANTLPAIDVYVSEKRDKGRLVGKGVFNRNGAGQTTTDYMHQVAESGDRYFHATNLSETPQEYRFRIISTIGTKMDRSFKFAVIVLDGKKRLEKLNPKVFNNSRNTFDKELTLELDPGETIGIGIFYYYEGKYIQFNGAREYAAMSGRLFVEATSVTDSSIVDRAGMIFHMKAFRDTRKWTESRVRKVIDKSKRYYQTRMGAFGVRG